MLARTAALATAGLVLATAAAAQVTPLPGPVVGVAEMNTKVFTLEQRVTALEMQARQDKAALAAANAEVASLKAQVAKLLQHTHDVSISVDYTNSFVNDVYNQKRTVVTPGVTFGNPKGHLGPPKY